MSQPFHSDLVSALLESFSSLPRQHVRGLVPRTSAHELLAWLEPASTGPCDSLCGLACLRLHGCNRAEILGRISDFLWTLDQTHPRDGGTVQVSSPPPPHPK